MIQRSAYEGLQRRLVIAFDVGTTYSGASYCILDPGDVPTINGVNRYPAQEHVGGDSKIPSILYYDQNGDVAAVGAEALQESIIEKAEDNGWVRSEWFKLHLRPAISYSAQLATGGDNWEDVNQDVEILSLPFNKSITTVFADFLRYLFKCTRDYIIETHANGSTLWSALEGEIHFILSHPNGWEGQQQTLMRRAAVMANLIPDTNEGHARIEFVTEGEASLHYCISSHLASDIVRSGAGVIIVDAGGGTVDLSSYAMTAPNKYEEIASADCVFQGSVYVTRRTRTFLEDKFRKAQSRYQAEEDLQTIVECFDKTTKLTVQEGEPSFIKFGTPRDKDPKVNIKGGKLKLESDEISTLFQPAVEGVVKAIKKQCSEAKRKIEAIFLVGGFAASNLLFSKLQAHFKDTDIALSRPDSHANKAVPDGAISFYIDHFVSTRVAKYTYGIDCLVSFQSGNLEHRRRLSHIVRSVSGEIMINGFFSAILPMGTSVSETKEFRKSYAVTRAETAQKTVASEILCYRGQRTSAPVWLDEDRDHFQTLCSVEADLSDVFSTLQLQNGPLGPYYSQEIDIILLFGLTELKAQLSWYENGQEKRGPAKVVYDIVDT